MQDTLHLSSSTTTHPFPNPHFASLSPPRISLLHFPPLPSTTTKTTPIISLPPKPPKNQEILSFTPPNPNSEFHEKLLYLDSLGIDFFSLLNAHPPIISTTTSSIKSTISLLRSVGLTAPDLRRALSMCPDLLTTPTSQILPALTFLLREARVEGRHLRYVIHRRPRLLTCSVETQLRPTLYFLQSTIGIDNVYKQTHLLSCSVENKLLLKIEYFQKLGFDYNDTIIMFRKFPSLFCYSIKDNFEPKFNYFVVEMGRDLKELREFPQYFSFSLENRIKPRHRNCVEKGVCLSLPVMLKSREERFRDRLELICSSSLPESKCTGSLLY